MKRTCIVLALCCGVFSALPAFSQAAAADTDQKFVDMAGQTDMLEAHLGQMAQDQGSAQGVKDLGSMLVTDHTSDYTQLSAAAGKANLTVPKGIDAVGNKTIASFEKLKGAAFDHRFAAAMVAGHEKAIAAYEKEAKDGQNADIKAYASAALPTLQKHLQAARDLEKTPAHHKKGA